MSSCKVIGLILIMEYCSTLTDHLDMSVVLVFFFWHHDVFESVFVFN